MRETILQEGNALDRNASADVELKKNLFVPGTGLLDDGSVSTIDCTRKPTLDGGRKDCVKDRSTVARVRLRRSKHFPVVLSGSNHGELATAILVKNLFSLIDPWSALSAQWSTRTLVIDRRAGLRWKLRCLGFGRSEDLLPPFDLRLGPWGAAPPLVSPQKALIAEQIPLRRLSRLR